MLVFNTLRYLFHLVTSQAVTALPVYTHFAVEVKYTGKQVILNKTRLISKWLNNNQKQIKYYIQKTKFLDFFKLV